MQNTQQNNLSLKPGLQFFNFEGAEIALDYQCTIERPSQLLILVNGFQRTRQDFRAFRKKFEIRCPHVATVSLDNRYCGETKVNEKNPLTHERLAQDIFAIAKIFMEKLNLNSFSLLGISMGGMVSLTLASMLPEGVLNNLFLVSTTAGGVSRVWRKNIDPSLLKYENKNTDLESTKKNMALYFADRFLKNSAFLFEMMCKSMLRPSQTNEIDTNFAAEQQFNISINFDGVSFLNKIKAKKTIIISGDEDKIVPLGNATYLSKNISNSQLIVYPEVGHLILIEEPEKFVLDVASFFQEST